MKGTLIGFGTIGMGHANAYSKMKNLEIIAVVDPTLERRKKAKEIFPNAKIYKSFEEMIKNENIDFVDICSPPSTHFEYITKGLSKNCHVICEKPLLLKTDEYKKICDLIRASNKVVYPSHNYKFAPILKKLHSAVRAKQFGNIVTGKFRTLRSGHAVGVPEWNPDWRRDCNISGGGIVRDHGPHSIYMACIIADKIPTAVSCIVGSLKNDQYSHTEDTAMLTLCFNDIKFTMDVSWANDVRSSYYCVIGEKETIIVENDLVLHTSTKNGLSKEIISSDFNDPSHKSWFHNMFLDFLNVINSPKEKQQFELILEAFITTLIIEKAYSSAKQNGKLINVVSDIDCFVKSINFDKPKKLAVGENHD